MYGLELPERLFWVVFVARQNIEFSGINAADGWSEWSKNGEWSTGLPSHPSYQDLNLRATRAPACWSGPPSIAAPRAAVLMQMDTERPLSPHGLVMAYREPSSGASSASSSSAGPQRDGDASGTGSLGSMRVRPVVDAMEPLILGTKGVRHEAVQSSAPSGQVVVTGMHRLCARLERLAERQLSLGTAEQDDLSWERRWLEVVLRDEAHLHQHQEDDEEELGATADQMTRSIFQSTMNALATSSGAVRNLPESFNLAFPRALEDGSRSSSIQPGQAGGDAKTSSTFLVLWDGFGSSPWRYLDLSELQRFLLYRVRDHYAFPLSPKWVTCDRGFLPIFEALLSSKHAQSPMEAWYPSASGLRERILSTARKVFGRAGAGSDEKAVGESEHSEAHFAVDGDPTPQARADERAAALPYELAALELRRRAALHRAKAKFQAAAVKRPQQVIADEPHAAVPRSSSPALQERSRASSSPKRQARKKQAKKLQVLLKLRNNQKSRDGTTRVVAGVASGPKITASSKNKMVKL